MSRVVARMEIRRLFCIAFLLAFIARPDVEASENPVRRYQRNARGSRQSRSNNNARREQQSRDGSSGRGIPDDSDPGAFEYEDHHQDYQANRNMYAYTPPNHEPQYDGYMDEGGLHDTSFGDQNGASVDILDEYTSTISSKILVAFSSACFTTVLVGFLCMMITSTWSPVLVLPFTVLFFVASFKKSSDLGKLSIAFGVVNILLLRRAKPSSTLSEFFFYLRGAFNLTQRRPYPPSENPWAHRFDPDDPNSIQFGMYSTILAIMLLGSTIGSNIAKQIPLFPTWIGALGAAGFCGYTSTLRDGRGDLLRFLGNSVVQCWSTFSEVSGEVELWDKLNKVSGKSMGHLSKLDSKYKIIDKLKFALAMLIGKVSSMSNQVRNDMQGNDDSGNRRRGGERDNQNYGGERDSRGYKDREGYYRGDGYDDGGRRR